MFKKLIIILVLAFCSLGSLPAVERYELPMPKRLVDSSANVMMKHVGLKEAKSRNDGEHIREYHKAIGLGYSDKKENYPYCQMAQSYFFWVANGKSWQNLEVLKTAGSQECFRRFKKSGKKTPPVGQKNDLLFFYIPNTVKGHTERIIAIMATGKYQTMGCNTGNGKIGSQREGSGNYIRIRSINERYGSLIIKGFGGFQYVD
ncbi:MAG TPA: hypothetical protein DCS19_04175 [Flavobacterium sp.]|nr:hypothetical protein [Flavobacterium sp.]